MNEQSHRQCLHRMRPPTTCDGGYTLTFKCLFQLESSEYTRVMIVFYFIYFFYLISFGRLWDWELMLRTIPGLERVTMLRPGYGTGGGEERPHLTTKFFF